MLLFCNNRVNIKLKNENKQKRRYGFISQSTEYTENYENINTYSKTEQEVTLIRTALERNEFLANILQQKRLQYFIDCMYIKEVKAGEILMEAGEIGCHLYISNTGTYEVTVKENVFIFNDVRVFGEQAILYSARRHATMRSLEAGSVWVLDCPVFKKLIIKTAIEEQEEMVSFLEKVYTINSVSKEKLYQVANLLKVEFFATSKKIITQGEIGDKFYIVRAGSVTVRKGDDKVSQLSKGEFFGELALLNDELCKTTVTADAPGVECLTLTRKQFIDHFGEIDEFVNLKMHPIYAEKLMRCTELDLADFDTLATLGIGGFGKVDLIRHKSYDDQIFALKSMRRMEIVGRSHQDQVYNERNLQMSCNSQFIVKLYRTYKDSKYVYLLLEMCLGGDLFTHLHRQKKHCFEESAAKFYAGCVLEALAYLHERGIIYRDLKPENIMVHYNGYLKLTDFGFAKRIDSKEKTYTFVGTAEYVAPELLLNKGHNKGVDYWAFGVLIYELLVGKTPFRTNDPGYLKTYKLILKGIDNAAFPQSIPGKAKGLIKKLCMHTSSDRLGCQRGGIHDIRKHSWFSGMNWYELNHFLIEPPFRPTLKSDVDTSYFDNCESRDNSIPLDDHTNWDDDF